MSGEWSSTLAHTAGAGGIINAMPLRVSGAVCVERTLLQTFGAVRSPGYRSYRTYRTLSDHYRTTIGLLSDQIVR